MNIYISVVSHGHCELIKRLGCIDKLSKEFTVVLKLNKPEENLTEDKFFSNCHIIDEKYGIGFGENNNYTYEYCKKNLNMSSDDYFVVLNPDVIIDVDTLSGICDEMDKNGHGVATLNLFKDENYEVYDNSVRKYPSFSDFFQSFIIKKNNTLIDKSSISSIQPVDWAAGSFLIFNSGNYNALKGFDTRYFMYCEDIDICYRSTRSGVPVMYYPHYKAIHLAGHNNRNIFSKHFYWHMRSAILFLWMKRKFN